MKDVEKKARFVQLRAKGLSYTKIAKEIETSKTILISWSKNLDDEISNLRAVELENLMDKYVLSKENELRTYSEQLSRIKEELGRRDLKKVDTFKLFDLQFRMIKKLEKKTELIEFKNDDIQMINDLKGVTHYWSA